MGLEIFPSPSVLRKRLHAQWTLGGVCRELTPEAVHLGMEVGREPLSHVLFEEALMKPSPACASPIQGVLLSYLI